MKLVFQLTVLILCLCLVPPGQESTGSLRGTVTHASGGVVPNATVTATSERTPRGISTKTDPSGRYVLSSLPVGTYTLEVVATGFATLKQERIDVAIGSQYNL